MNPQSTKTNILIVGATGKLGVFVTKHCLSQPDFHVNILVRDPQKNKELTAQVEAAGGKVLKGDVTQPETIKGTTKGMHTVIMTFDSLDSKVFVDGHIAVINDCVENGVERVVPSSFISNIAKYSPEEKERSYIAIKIKVFEYLKTAPIKSLIIDTGLITEWILPEILSLEFGYWGDENLKLQMTSYEDTARITVAAVARKDLCGYVIFIGDEVSVSDVAETYNRLRGTSFKPRKLGTFEDVRALREKAEKEGDPSVITHAFHEITFDERTRFDKIDNAQFPEVKPTSAEEFLKLRPDLKVGASE